MERKRDKSAGSPSLKCPQCGRMLRLPAGRRPKQGKCPECSTVIHIPPESGERGTGEYRYQAFISYRHVEPDRDWAKWLHGSLERLPVPKRIVRDFKAPRRIAPIFRDEEELSAASNLSEAIKTALRESRHLIVICSPRARDPGAPWVDREVQYFRELGRNDRILAVLIEGEPAEAFPPSLCEIRGETVGRSGQTRQQIEDVEPLAADVRQREDERPRRVKKKALIRLAAGIVDCSFDEFWQRDRQRRIRNRVLAASILTPLLVAIMAVITVLYGRYAEQRRLTELAVASKQQTEREKERVEQEKATVISREQEARQSLHQTAEELSHAQSQAERITKQKEEEEKKAAKLGIRAKTEEEKRRAAEEESQRAWNAQRLLEFQEYRSKLRLAQQAIGGANHEEAEALLRQCPVEQRGWEWRHLWQICSQSRDAVHSYNPSVKQVQPLTAVAFSPNGKWGAGFSQGTILVWDLESGRKSGEAAVLPKGNHQDSQLGAISFAVDSKGTRIVVRPSQAMYCMLYDLGGNQATRLTTRYPRPIIGECDGSLSFSPDGRWIGATQDAAFCVWDAATAQLACESRSSETASCRLLFSRDSNRLLVYGTKKQTYALQRGSWVVESAERSADATGFIVSCPDAEGYVWVSRGGGAIRFVGKRRNQVRKIGEIGGPCTGLAISPDGSRLAAASVSSANASAGDAEVKLFARKGDRSASWDVVFQFFSQPKNGAVDLVAALALFRPGSTFGCVAFTPNGKYLAAHMDGGIKIWDTESHELLRTLKGVVRSLSEVYAWEQPQQNLPNGWAAQLKPDARTPLVDCPQGLLNPTADPHSAICAGEKNFCTIDCRFDASAQRYRSSLHLHATFPETIRFLTVRAARVIVAGDTMIGTRVVDRPDPAHALRDGEDADSPWRFVQFDRETTVCSTSMDVDGQSGFAVCGFSDGSVDLVDLEKGAKLRTIDAHTGRVQAVCLADDGAIIASCGEGESAIRLWDREVGSLLGTLEVVPGPVECLAVSPSGQLLASGGADGSVTFWDVSDRRKIAVHRGHDGAVHCLTFSPGGARLVSGGEDGRIGFWNPELGEPLVTFSGHSKPVGRVVFSDDGVRLLTQSVPSEGSISTPLEAFIWNGD